MLMWQFTLPYGVTVIDEINYESFISNTTTYNLKYRTKNCLKLEDKQLIEMDHELSSAIGNILRKYGLND